MLCCAVLCCVIDVATAGAADVCQVAHRLQQAAADCHDNTAQQQQQPQGAVSPAYVLLLVDGTWQQAKEMFDAAAVWLLPPEGPGQQVQLPKQQQQQQQEQEQEQDHSAGKTSLQQAAEDDAAATAQVPLLLQRDSGARIRTEPAEGTCSTLEAVAAAVSMLEGGGAQSQAVLFDALMTPLRLVTEQQAAFDPAVAARLQPGASGVVQSKRKMGMRRRLGC